MKEASRQAYREFNSKHPPNGYAFSKLFGRAWRGVACGVLYTIVKVETFQNPFTCPVLQYAPTKRAIRRQCTNSSKELIHFRN